MSQPPVEVHCTSFDNQSNTIVVDTEVYPDGFGQGQPYFINTRWDKSGNQVTFQSVDFGGNGDPGEPMLNGAAIRASAEEIDDQLNPDTIDDSTSFPDPEIGWRRIDSSGN
jgi:hypothetical protein